MSVTTDDTQGQGNGNQNANQVTQQSQNAAGNRGGDNNGTGAANQNQQGAGAGNGQAVVTLLNADPHQLLLWNGNWPGATGKIATYMSDKAGTPASQKDIAEQVFNFLKDPNQYLGAIGTDTQPVAYLLHVAGTTNVRVLYGLSPVSASPFIPDKPKLFRALMRDLESETARYPAMIRLPANIVEVQGVEVPKEDHFLQQLGDDTIDKTTPWIKTGASNGAMQAGQKETADMMKLVPVPLYTVLDGLEKDLAAGEVFERIKFINDIDNKEFLAHAMNFCKSCVTQYGANAKKPTVAAGVFAQLPEEADRTWAMGRTMQLCPFLTVQQPAPAAAGAGPGTGAEAAMAATAGLNTQMMELMKQLLQNQGGKNGSGKNGQVDSDDNALTELPWEKQLNMAKSGVAHLLKFCGLEEDQESLIPKVWFRMGEKGMDAVDRHRELRKVLEAKKTYEEVRAPVTAAMIKLIAKRDWCEGEATVTMANIMKGLSIFAMRPLTDEEMSEYNEYDECLDRASSTTVKDVAGGSGKRKHHVPSTCHGFETYLKSLINILDAITDGNSPHADDLKSIVAKLQRWDSSARMALTQKQIGTYMWVILKESRRFFNDDDNSAKSPAFRAMLGSLDSQTPYETVGLPATLLAAPKENAPHIPKGNLKKRLREEEAKVGKEGGAIPPFPQSPLQKQKVLQEKHPILVEKLGSTLAKAKRHNVGMNQLCELVGMKVWDMFPIHCGYTTLYGKCGKVGCQFNHDKLPDGVAKKIVTNFKKVIDDPTLITGKSQI